MFIRHAFYLSVVNPEWGPGSEAESKCWALPRLLSLPINGMGLVAAERLEKLQHQCKVAYIAFRDRLSANEQTIVHLEYSTFAKHLAHLGWVKLAEHSELMQTQSTSTKNFPLAFPPEENRSLPELGEILGFRHCDAVDINGKNLFVHLFTSLSYSYGSFLFLEHAFDDLAPRLPGDYRKAMRQPVTSGKAKGHKPLHVVCNGSDVQFQKLAILKSLIENGIVPSTDIFTLRNNKVTF